MLSAAAQSHRPAPDELKDRVVLITGAGDGIGRAAALACARHGATVILLGRTQSKLEAVYDEIVANGQPEPAISMLDLARAQGQDYFQLAEQIDKTWGRLDGLLHNAGMLGQRAPIEHYDVGIWHQVMHLNLNVPFILTQVLMPMLRKSSDASIVFTSSGVGRQSRAYWGAYAVAKFGIEGLSQTLADELKTEAKIRVNCINPGGTRTRMRAAAYPGEDPGSRPEPASLMGPYLWLLGPASRGVTGQSIDCQ
ncbi:MAG: YciK family oxidoreductase [Gammaproteobacteria bacterium]|nr:YciK family oxidoreductase [Gammaproteobacteria bacterium]